MQFNSISNPDGFFALALDINESFFGGDCKNYLNYDCSQYNCFSHKEHQRNDSFPYFEIQGHTIHTKLALNISYSSNNYTNKFYSEKYLPNSNLVSNKRSRIMGLGLDGSGIIILLEIILCFICFRESRSFQWTDYIRL